MYVSVTLSVMYSQQYRPWPPLCVARSLARFTPQFLGELKVDSAYYIGILGQPAPRVQAPRSRLIRAYMSVDKSCAERRTLAANSVVAS